MTTLSRLQRIARWPALASAQKACNTGILNGHGVSLEPVPFVSAVYNLLLTNIGGKHGNCLTSDEGWGWCVGALARIAIEHGNVSAGRSTTCGAAGSAFRESQRLWLPGNFPGVVLFHEYPRSGVDQTYEWAYRAQACTTEDNSLLSLVDGWAWYSVFAEQNGDTASAAWCRRRIVEVATTLRRLITRHGGVSQFYDSRTGIMLPGREHEPAAVKVRSTIDAGFIPLYAWAVTGDAEWRLWSMTSAHEAGVMLEEAPWGVWFQWEDDGSVWEPVGAGDPSDPDTRYRIMPDRGPAYDERANAKPTSLTGMAAVAQKSHLQNFAKLPMPTPDNPTMGTTRTPEANARDLGELRNRIDAAMKEDTNEGS